MADVDSDKQSGTKGKGRGLKDNLSLVVASVWSVYTLIYLFNVPTYMGKVIFPVAHRGVSVGLIAILVFLVVPAKKGQVTDRIAWYDLLAILFILEGLFKIIASIQLRPVINWGWMLFNGILALIIGTLIWISWPSSAVWAIGILVGINIVFGGWAMVMLSLASRQT